MDTRSHEHNHETDDSGRNEQGGTTARATTDARDVKPALTDPAPPPTLPGPGPAPFPDPAPPPTRPDPSPSPDPSPAPQPPPGQPDQGPLALEARGL